MMETTTSKELAKVQTRKAYTITKRREKWSDEEHNKFLEAIGLYGRAWQRIQEHVGTKTAVQIRSHAQKFFLKLQKGVDGMCLGHPRDIEIPPPRPKRKPFNPSDEVKVSSCSETSVWPTTDKVVMDSKSKKPVALATEESMNHAFRKYNSCASVHCGNNSATYPLAEHLQMIDESVKKAGKYFHLFEMNGNFTNPQMNFTPEERYQTLLSEESYQNIVSPQFKGAKSSVASISASFAEHHQDANADLSLSLSPSRSVTTYRSKDPAMASIHQAENGSIALSNSTTNSFSNPHAEASIAASLLAHLCADSSTVVTNRNIDFGEAQDTSPNISAIIAATVDAATAWWKLNGLLTSAFQSNISSATQGKSSKDLEGQHSGTNENTKWQSSSSSPDTVFEKIRVERTEKPANQYMLSSLVEGINEVNQVPSKRKHDPSPFSEQVNNVQHLRNAGRFFSKPLAFEALFSQKVLPQSFGPLNMDDEPDLNLGKEEEEEALGLHIDLNRKIFAQNVSKSAEEEEGNASSLNFMGEKRKHRTDK